MRDPDSQVRARQQLDEREPGPRSGSASPRSVDEHDTEPQIDRVSGADDADLDMAAFSRAVLVFDTTGRIVDANPVAETLVGYARLELVGKPVDMVAPQLARMQLGRIRFVPASTGVCLHHRNGRAISVDVWLCPRDTRSTVAVFCTVETTEAGLRQEDVAQIVHDLRNPLSTIALEARLLDDKLARGNPSDTRDALARITRNIEFLDRMVQDLLDLCMLDAGRLELRRRPTELRMLLAHIIDRVVPTRDRARVVLHAAEPVTTLVDNLKIERVVANLLGNALKYAPTITGIDVRLTAGDDVIRVSVSDTGAGITPAETGYVFDKFRRGSTAGAHEGSGLGLYVSKKIIEAHGGRIDVTSVRGTGSQFFFELPTTCTTS
jgi:PAS domain S-box-containing protein